MSLIRTSNVRLMLREVCFSKPLTIVEPVAPPYVASFQISEDTLISRMAKHPLYLAEKSYGNL